MATAPYDGHAVKRQRTDVEGRDRGFGQPQYYNFNNQRGGNRPVEDEKVNHILLMTVMNPAYPITVDVIHTISSPSGKVLRIVIFKKNGVQAMVEFDGTESAKRAKDSLHGADIYSGCCTLKIEYAKPTRLNVYKNDNESWDYTNPQLGKSGDRPALLQEPRGFTGSQGQYREGGGRGGAPGPTPPAYEHGDGYDSYGNPSTPRGNASAGYGEHYGPPGDRYGGPPPPDRYGNREAYDQEGPRGGGGGYGQSSSPPGGSPQQGAVMMVYGLNAKEINCDKLFNLFCLYGNVIRVKFLKSKEGCAMVQMGDAISMERSIANLNNATLFDCKLQLKYSKQAFLNDVQQPFELPDGSPSFQDYMGNRNNRYTNPEAASKNRILPPSKTLHFFNTPYGISEDELRKVFEDAGAKTPVTIKLFPSKTVRSSSGLFEYETVSDALEALTVCNHTPIPNPNGKFPYILKLCFSTTGSRF